MAGASGSPSSPAGGNGGASPPGPGTGNAPAGATPPAAPKFPKGSGVGDSIRPIEGRDLDGEEFSLDDYAGKVMMIDFWGDW